MTSSLVGSEMCIRDRASSVRQPDERGCAVAAEASDRNRAAALHIRLITCLLYTSDAADDM
eukprot:10290985-Prorocentrum_lima.AAC.1